MRTQRRKTLLMLEDGTIEEGFSPEIPARASGRIIVNDSIAGFQEILTDPANTGCVILFTFPHVGNYGAAGKFSESPGCRAAAAAVKTMSRFFSNWQAETSLGDFLTAGGTPFIEGINTRRLARIIHEKGEMKAAILPGARGKADWGKIPLPRTRGVSSSDIRILSKQNRALKIGILDLGVKKSLLSFLAGAGAGAIIIPYSAGHREISRLGLHGLIISSGPEDPEGLSTAAETAGNLVGSLPILGIGAGCIALAMSLGASIGNLASGHRGMNYPVLPPGSLSGTITSQNHRLFPEAKSHLKKTSVALVNPDDGTVEAIESKELKLTGILFEPAALNGAPRPELTGFLERAREGRAS